MKNKNGFYECTIPIRLVGTNKRLTRTANKGKFNFILNKEYRLCKEQLILFLRTNLKDIYIKHCEIEIDISSLVWKVCLHRGGGQQVGNICFCL